MSSNYQLLKEKPLTKKMIKTHLSVWKLSNTHLDDSFSKDHVTMEIENISSKMIINAQVLMFIGWSQISLCKKNILSLNTQIRREKATWNKLLKF